MDLAVQLRQKFGKKTKALRREGFIPAELYGNGVENAHLAVPAKDFARVWREAGTNTVVGLLVGADLPAGRQERRPAIIHDVGRNYITGEIEHVDFYQVRMNEKVEARIPVEFLGVAPAVKDKGGVLNKGVLEIEVEALPGDLPRCLEVDLSALSDLNQSIYVKDIAVPKGVKVLIDPETPVATVTEPRPEEVAEVAPADVTGVKVETEEKKEEREAEKTEKTGETEGKSE